MKPLRMRCLVASLFQSASQMFGGVERQVNPCASDEFDPHRIEFALETGYLFGAINPPADYQIGALFLTERIRWGVIRTDSWLRGYHQFYISAIAEPIFQRNRESLLRIQRGVSLQFRSATLAIRSLYFGRCRRRRDRQPPRSAGRPGAGFHVQHFIGGGYFLHRE